MSPLCYDHKKHTHINCAGRSGSLQRCAPTAASCERTAVSERSSVAQCVSVLDLYPKSEEPSVTTSSPSAPPPRSGALLLEANSSANTLGVPALNPSAHMQTHSVTDSNVQSAGSSSVARTLTFLCPSFVPVQLCVLHLRTH